MKMVYLWNGSPNQICTDTIYIFDASTMPAFDSIRTQRQGDCSRPCQHLTVDTQRQGDCSQPCQHLTGDTQRRGDCSRPCQHLTGDTQRRGDCSRPCQHLTGDTQRRGDCRSRICRIIGFSGDVDRSSHHLLVSQLDYHSTHFCQRKL